MDYEKLGVFYLGRPYDIANKKPIDDLLLYDSKDLMTHAICVGMTGSGKTGLCINLLEEAVLDNIPSIIIDPKGDLTNLLLTFPELQPKDFEPWVNPDDAMKKNMTIEEYSMKQAETWKNGLASWGQDGKRIEQLKNNADYAIYTPGSQAGLPISILRSFEAPNIEIINDDELLRDRINTTITSLLGLIGLNADPIESREHILLSNIMLLNWKASKNLDIVSLIHQIQTPEFSKVGVIDLEVFYPSKERFALSMKLNNLLAAPGFSTWMEGEPLDIDILLHTKEGKPRVSIFSIAHLNDSERMFFVSLLLNQIVGWMRTQSGTTSLRAIVYMDEIFGYFPPVANPPSKTPLLTLLKQARAFGVGVVLVTQNPVDLDYKGLSNTGTWLIGRLQTERDKARVLDGLEGAASSTGSTFNRQKLEQIMAGLSSRIFLMHNVHEDEPIVFESRWAMSYLRGPLARQQIKLLMDPYKAINQNNESIQSNNADSTIAKTNIKKINSLNLNQRPVLKNDLQQWFIPLISQPISGQTLSYSPTILLQGKVYFSNQKINFEKTKEVFYLIPVKNDPIPIAWDKAFDNKINLDSLQKSPIETAFFAELPAIFNQNNIMNDLKKEALQWLFLSQQVKVFMSPSTKISSYPDETERDFRIRISQLVREERDKSLDSLKEKYAPKKVTIEEKIRRAEQVLQKEKEQVKHQNIQTAISIGATLLGALTGRKSASYGGLSTTARSASRTMKETKDIGTAKETLDILKAQLTKIEEEFQQKVNELNIKMDYLTEPLEIINIKPNKNDISIQLIALCWAPYWTTEAGAIIQAF